ncbi:MAG: phosphoglucomutase [Chloroflexaceae bacterium]|nr:phosphoglucomutase [Chloroflexaceae bacterium]
MLEPGATLWEGIFAADFTLEQVRRYAVSLAESLVARKWSCLLTYDTRFLSNLLAEDIARVLSACRVPVSLAAAPSPLPAVYYALKQRQADCALMVSARNRPYWYNGLLLIEPDSDEPPIPWLPNPSRLLAEQPATPPSAMASVVNQPFPFLPSEQQIAPPNSRVIRSPYMDMLRQVIDINLIRRATLTIIVDPMHGTTAGYFPALIGDTAQTMAIEINREIDPLFGKTVPLPAEASLNRLRKLVRESDSHLGIALSADGTALSVIDNLGEPLSYLELVLLLGSYLSQHYRQKGMVVAPPPARGTPLANSVDNLSDWQDEFGLQIELSADATNRITTLASEPSSSLVVGCTNEGQILLYRYSPYPDAVLAGLLLVEMVARKGMKLGALIIDLRSRLGI